MKKIIVIVSVIALAAILFLVWMFSDIFSQTPKDFIEVKIGEIAEEVNVTGQMKAVENLSLSFQTVGKVNFVGAKAGDKVVAGAMLAALERSELSAQLAQDAANLESEKAKLAELKRGSRPEELRIDEIKVANAKISLDDANKNLADKLNDAYTKSDDAVRNKVDQFISNPKSPNPQLNFSVSSTQLKSDIESGRVLIEAILVSWALSFDETSKTLNQVKSFLDKTALAVNSLTPTTNLTQATIDTYKSDVSTARTNVNAAITNLSAAYEKFRAAESALALAENELALEKAGASPEGITAEEAKVKQAEAKVRLTEAQLEKTVLRSPIAGIVTKQDAKLGETVSANAALISIISLGKLEIEVNIPEVDIGKIRVGNPARFTLDAFPGENFSGKVFYMDPAETVIDGVVNFKIKIQPDGDDARFKSGFTANIAVETSRKPNVFILPQSALIEKDDGVFVSKLEGAAIKEVLVIAGARGQNGMVEIISGLAAGDRVLNVGVKKE